MLETLPSLEPGPPTEAAKRRVDLATGLIAAGSIAVFFAFPTRFLLYLPLGVVLIAVERVLPLDEQRILRAGLLVDTLHLLFTRTISALIAATVSVAIVAAVTPVVRHQLAAVQSLSWWLLLPMALLLDDLGGYWWHRASHRIPLLWRFHSIHHTSEAVDWLSFGRMHPVDIMGGQIAAFTPVLLLGFPPSVLAALVLVTSVVGPFEHANTRVTLGPLVWLIASPEFHRWHHADERRAYDRNFCGTFPLWDVVFGTVFLPRNERPRRYGVKGYNPASYADQILDPFSTPCQDAPPARKASAASR